MVLRMSYFLYKKEKTRDSFYVCSCSCESVLVCILTITCVVCVGVLGELITSIYHPSISFSLIHQHTPKISCIKVTEAE